VPHPDRDGVQQKALRHVVSAPSSPRARTPPVSPRLCPVDEVMLRVENLLRARVDDRSSDSSSSTSTSSTSSLAGGTASPPQAQCPMTTDQICRLRFYSTAEHVVHVFLDNRNVITGKKCSSKPRQRSLFRVTSSRSKRQDYFLVPAQAKCDGVMMSVRAVDRLNSIDASLSPSDRRKQSNTSTNTLLNSTSNSSSSNSSTNSTNNTITSSTSTSNTSRSRSISKQSRSMIQLHSRSPPASPADTITTPFLSTSPPVGAATVHSIASPNPSSTSHSQLPSTSGWSATTRSKSPSSTRYSLFPAKQTTVERQRIPLKRFLSLGKENVVPLTIRVTPLYHMDVCFTRPEDVRRTFFWADETSWVPSEHRNPITQSELYKMPSELGIAEGDILEMTSDELPSFEPTLDFFDIQDGEWLEVVRWRTAAEEGSNGDTATTVALLNPEISGHSAAEANESETPFPGVMFHRETEPHDPSVPFPGVNFHAFSPRLRKGANCTGVSTPSTTSASSSNNRVDPLALSGVSSPSVGDPSSSLPRADRTTGKHDDDPLDAPFPGINLHAEKPDQDRPAPFPGVVLHSVRSHAPSLRSTPTAVSRESFLCLDQHRGVPRWDVARASDFTILLTKKH